MTTTMLRCPLCETKIPESVCAPALLNTGDLVTVRLSIEQVCADGKRCAMRMNARRDARQNPPPLDWLEKTEKEALHLRIVQMAHEDDEFAEMGDEPTEP